MNGLVGVLEAVLPSIGVGLIFYFAMRKIVRADRNERNAMAALEAQEDQRLAMVHSAAVKNATVKPVVPRDTQNS